MTRPQVSIRLATDGKAQVQKDFADIADHGGAQAARLRDKWERETQQIERLTDRAAKTAERLSAVSLSPVQQVINRNTGTGAGQTGAARASAAALAQELDRAESEAKQLLAAIDPLFGAQLRYSSNVQRINELKRVGALDGARFAQLLEAEERALDQATRAATRNNGVRVQTRAGMQQLSFQAGDVAQQLALGTNASIIFAQQSGQVIQALQIMGGEGNKFLRFLGGPWGLALTTAAVVLTPLIGKLLQTKDGVADLVNKMRDQAATAGDQARANEIWARSLEGVHDWLRKNREALDQLEDKGKSAARLAFESADVKLAEAKALEINTQELVRNAQAHIARNQAMLTGVSSPQARDFAMQNMADAQSRLDALRGDLAAAGKDIAEVERRLTEAKSHFLIEVASRDPTERIRRQYDRLVEQARERAVAEGKVGDQLTRQIALLRVAERADLDKLQKSKRSASAQEGDWTASAIGALLKDRFGGTITSTTGGKHAKGSFHYAGQAVDFVPSGGMSAISKREIYDFLRSVGVSIKELLGPGDRDHSDHFHVAFAKRRSVGAEMAGDRAVEGERDKAVRQQNAFEEKRDELNARLLVAQMDLVSDIQSQAEFAERQVRADQARLDSALQNDVEEKKLSQAHADELKAINEMVAGARLDAIASRRRLQLIDDRDKTEQQLAGFKLDELRFQEQMARSSEDRRRLQLDIIDAEQAQRLAHLQAALAKAEEAKEYAEAARIQAEINDLPRQRERAEAQSRLSTVGPIDQFFDRMPQSAGEMNDWWDSQAVRGMEGFVDLIGAATEGWDSMQDVALNTLRSITAELLRMAAMKFLFSLLGMGAGAGAGAGAAAGAAAGAGAMGNVLGSVPIGMAAGTEYHPGGLTWVGEFGKELVRLPRGSKVVPAAESRRIDESLRRGAANGNARAGDNYHITVDARGRGGTPAQDRRSGQHIAAGIHAGIADRAKKGMAG